MKGLAKRRLALALSLGLALWAPSRPLGAEASRRGHDPDCPRATLQQVAAALARRWHVRVAVEPAIAPQVLPEGADDAMSIDQALNTALGPLRHVAWRRVYLPLAAAPSPDSVERLVTAVRSLELQEPGSVLIEDPGMRRITACLRPPSGAASLRAWLDLGKLGPQPVYLIYGTAAPVETASTESRFADLQRQQMTLPLPPEQRALAMVQMMRALQALPPAEREAFAGRTFEAGTRLWERTPAAQREEMIRQSVGLMKAFGAVPPAQGAGAIGNSAPQRPLRPAPPAGADPRAVAVALSDRYHARFVVDPALLLTGVPEMPDADPAGAATPRSPAAGDPALPGGSPAPARPLPEAPPAEKALAVLAARLPGAAGRRVSLTPAELQRLPAAEKLAASVRDLEGLESSSVAIEEAATGRVTLYLKDQPAAMVRRLKEQGSFSDPPLYLLYSTTPTARGATPAERAADLQQQQIGLILRMSPDQMAHSMAALIDSFPAADTDTRARLMGLPAMAGLMAVWLPREVKESGQPLGDGSP